jgi:hypothetical protein
MTDNKKQKYIYMPWSTTQKNSLCVIAESEIECYKKILLLYDSEYFVFVAIFGNYQLTNNDIKVKALSYLDVEKYTMAKDEINELYTQELAVSRDCLAKIINKCKRFALADRDIKSGIIK